MKAGFAVSMIAGLLAALGILSMVIPSSEAVRVRNSLLFEVVDEADLDWRPDSAPSDFKQETSSAPPRFTNLVDELRGEEESLTGLAFGRRVGARLIDARRRGGAIQSSTQETLDTILSQGIGYCADYTQVVNGLAYAGSVPVREWGMSFDKFGGNGHGFTELYDEGLGKWTFIDTFYSFYVVDRETGEPLSALEFRDRLRSVGPASAVRLVGISERGFRFKSEADALAYYRRGVEQFYLWYGNNVFEYDASGLIAFGASISRSLEQALGIILGLHPEIRIPRTEGNGEMIAALARTRAVFLALLTLLIISSLVALLCALAWLRCIVSGRRDATAV